MLILKKLFYYYTSILMTIMVIGGFYITKISLSLLVQNILLLPIVFLLWSLIFKISLKPKVLILVLVYSTIIALIISVGGIFTIKTSKEFFANLMFLPITIQLVTMLILHVKETKKRKNIFQRL